ncbi:ABC transporter permease [Solirubrobacter sp. CPCC 204708]|uniref:ABC transporter permease n=1 Tax=Solirubrobacter deserti TaxID=2282478 RepID=A0ABT4RJU6_9ACTN|nr:ABC transporter permease [Solirubrobacter deserti]MBE2315845.1 ABC transporter permease [Solirubrobacter deserti]MDA0138819.1 ABC transporter permease [Solirubrobacter deserti]
MSVADAPSQGAGRRLKAFNLVLELRAFIALIVIIVVFGLMSDAYLTWDNLVTMTKHVAINAILAIGMLMVILTGGIDLSVGSIVGLAGIVAGVLLEGLTIGGSVLYLPVWGVILCALAVGTGVGAVNGALVTRFNVAPFIATLGTLYMARGVALLISGGETYPNLGGSPALGNTGFDVLGTGKLAGIPVSIWLMVAFGIAAVFLTRRTPFGRWVYALGGNARAAELSGVPVRRVTMRVYMISGLCAAMAGLIIASELTSAAPQAGETFELNAIAAVVIGGASLSGGRGAVRGALIGAFVIGFLADGLVILGVSTFWQIVIKGAVIVLAVILDQSQQKIQRRGAAIAAAAATERPAAARA